MIKSIIFDFNGVFVEDAPENIVHKKLGSKRIPLKIFELLWFRELTLVQKGKKPAMWLWQKIYPKVEKKALEKKISESYTKIKKINSMFRLCKKLSKKYFVYCLTNTNDIQAKAYKKKGFYKIFHKAFLSNEIKEVKPMPKAFSMVLKEIKEKPENCLFVDDSLKNVLVAKALGFKAVKFNNFEQFCKEIKKIGIKI